MTPRTVDLARFGRTAKPFAWIGCATLALSIVLAIVRRTIGADNLASLSVVQALNTVSGVLNATTATLFCLSLASVLAVRATSDELRRRDEEWRHQIILVEIDEPSSENPPTTDPSDVALAAFTRWYHASIALTALFCLLWALLQALPFNVSLSTALPLWLYPVLNPLTQLLFLASSEMTVLLILVRRWITA